MPCPGPNQAALGLPVVQDSQFVSMIAEERLEICNSCPRNKEGICLSVAAKYGNERAVITNGVVRLSLKCPLGKWGSHKSVCPSCNRYIEVDEILNACKWCKVKIELNKGRALQRHPFNNAIPFASNSPDGIFLKIEDLARDSATLAGLVPKDVKAIIGVARSGLTPANIVATMLHKPIYVMRQTQGDIVSGGHGWRLGDHPVGREDKVVVVDDTVMTGNSIKAIRPILQKEFPRAIYSSVYVNPTASIKPDIYVRELSWPHLLEWNLFNSVLSPNCAVDFDGVLCEDCPPDMDDDGPRYMEFLRTVRPKYLPRRVPVPLIVTARIEKYREPTVQWLRDHGVAFHQLIMHPARSLVERNRDDIAAYKAKHYLQWAARHTPKPPPTIFIESDDRQAKVIARHSRRFVVCPSTANCYGDARV